MSQQQEGVGLDQAVRIVDARGNGVTLPLRALLCLRGQDMVKLLQTLGYTVPLSDSSYEEILTRALARVPRELDAQEGSVIYDALAIACVELAGQNVERAGALALSYASGSAGKYLDLRVAEHGLTRLDATSTVRAGHFYKDEGRTALFEPALGSVYSVGEVQFTVVSPHQGGAYMLRCNQSGDVGNRPVAGAALLPEEYADGLAAAVLGDVLVPGKEQESDEALYKRFVKQVTRPAFGGNRADYENHLLQVEGVGKAKLQRATPQAGYVRICLLGADFLPPNEQVLERARERLDPVAGEGMGLVPMAHEIELVGAKGRRIAVTARVQCAGLPNVQVSAKEAVEGYFAQLRKTWGEYSGVGSMYYPIVVRVSQVENAILSVPGVVDIADTMLDGKAENIALGGDETCILGDVTIEILPIAQSGGEGA